MKIIRVEGGLASQMSAYALHQSLDNNGTVYLDLSWYTRNESHNGFELFELFNLPKNKTRNFSLLYSRVFIFKVFRKLFLNAFTINAIEKKYNYDPRVLEDNRFFIYEQCWTSWKYFKGAEGNLKKFFTFPQIIEKKNMDILALISKTSSVSIHVRRGDYLSVPGLSGLASLSFYEKAIQYIREHVENPTFFVFSDDIEWCRKNIKLSQKYFIDWNTGKNSFRDMQLMSNCQHNIIPNSGFSWWSAYLNDNADKIIVCPEKWGNQIEGVDLADMAMDSWIKIKNQEK